ncbi:MAG TPA: cytosine permease [Bryobacteraceae bacterium]|nr:cytosine permease [Bryobacteraceae bacterium]
MAEAMLPDYIARAVPNPQTNRAPWYVNTAPTYAGIFLWVVFYMKLAESTIDRASIWLCLGALLVAGLLSYKLYYYVPAMLGMKTGYPLYVVGSSTFGSKGGYIMPGLLMGLLQIGWFSVGTFVSTNFILNGFGVPAQPRTALFAIIAVIWGYTIAYIGAKGIQYVSRVAIFLNAVPLLMVIFVFLQARGGIANYTPAKSEPFSAFALILATVIGFFATAGAAGADFGMNSRDKRDVRYGGLVGIALAILIAGGLPLLSVAGAHGLNPSLSSYSYDAVIADVGGFLAPAMFFLFTIASIPSACFCAFIAGNSFSTMIPGVPRIGSMMAGVSVAIVLAITGVAADLVGFFNIVGASFGPICGAMAADYMLSGWKWAGPRAGINWAGYGAWAAGFIVGILPFLPLPPALAPYSQPAVLYSLIVGFIVYVVLAKAGLEPSLVPVERPEPVPVRSARAKA